MNRRIVQDGTPWEQSVAYCRAVRVGEQIFVSGTTASDEHGSTQCVGDAYGQAKVVFKKIESALQKLGATLQDVVRTRMFVTDISRWEEIGRAHQEWFADILPAATMVEVARLVNPDHLIEIEVDAVVQAAASDEAGQ